MPFRQQRIQTSGSPCPEREDRRTKPDLLAVAGRPRSRIFARAIRQVSAEVNAQAAE
jgi:hypothetical protein